MSWEAWGTPEELDWPDCETCEGAGEVVNDYGHLVRCPDCAGDGFVEPDYSRFDDDVI